MPRVCSSAIVTHRPSAARPQYRASKFMRRSPTVCAPRFRFDSAENISNPFATVCTWSRRRSKQSRRRRIPSCRCSWRVVWTWATWLAQFSPFPPAPRCHLLDLQHLFKASYLNQPLCCLDLEEPPKARIQLKPFKPPDHCRH